MRPYYLPLLVTLLAPAIGGANDFVFTNKRVQPEQQQEELMQQEQQYPAQQQGQQQGQQQVQQMQQQGGAVGYTGQQGMLTNGTMNSQPLVVGNGHEVPPSPPGWDSLTTGTANGGGVLGSGNAMGSDPVNTLNGNPITNGSVAQSLLGNMANGEYRASYGDVSVGSDGDMSPKERAMYASFLSSLLQVVRSQPDTVANPTNGYNGGGWQPVTPAFNNTSQPARFNTQPGSMGISAPAVPCPRGGVAGAGC